MELDLIGPDHPLLNEEDKKDLAVLGELSRSAVRVQQLLGLQSEQTERAVWNSEAACQLGNLSQLLGDIPSFGKANHRSTSPKGKERDRPKSRAACNISLQDAEAAWFRTPSG